MCFHAHAALVDNAAKVAWHMPRGAVPLAVVKANAYGHGLDTAAKAFLDGGFAELGVADINEAITLRQVSSSRFLCWLRCCLCAALWQSTRLSQCIDSRAQSGRFGQQCSSDAKASARVKQQCRLCRKLMRCGWLPHALFRTGHTWESAAACMARRSSGAPAGPAQWLVPASTT